MKLTTLLLFLFLTSTLVVRGQPQEKPVTGTVTDAVTGEPLPGVNVIIEGTVTGTSTDLNGKFSLPKPADGAVITFSFIGYTTERITYSGQSVINVAFSQLIRELDQVVVIGYGTIRKSDLTGSVASVSSKDLEKASPVNLQSALQGRVAGLMITSNDGSPGNEATIRIRGIGTVNNNDPLYVVDGMLIDNGDKSWNGSTIAFLSPWDIESIEVLKDASAQAIYGSRGANGVVLITTRKGTEGVPKITFSSSVSYESLARRAKVLNAAEYKDYFYTSYYNGYLRSIPDADPNVSPDTLYAKYPTLNAVVKQYEKGYDTDWMKEILNTNRISQNYDLLLSGGTKDIHYSASAGYTNKKGILMYSDYKRQSYRLNTDFKAGKFITLGENLGISTSTKLGDYYNTAPVSGAVQSNPLTPVLKPESEVDKNDPDYIYNKYAPQIDGSVNPVMSINLIYRNMKTNHLTMVGNMFAEAAILKSLKLRTSLGFDIYRKDFSYFDPKWYLSSVASNNVNSLKEEYFGSNGWVWENTLTWNKILKDHSITALLGYTSEYTHAKYQTAIKKGSPSNDPEMQTFDAATTEATVTGGYDNFSMISYLGRINYSFRDKYLVTASIRRDGSSKFGPGHRWGMFPSFSLGWKIIGGKSFNNTGAGFVSLLKLRGGWGQIGNSSLPVYNAYVSQVGSTIPNDDLRYMFGDKVYHGYWLKTIGTPNITWETTEQTNIGLEIAVLKNTLSITADYYIKNTRNMLLQVPVVNYAGYPSSAAPYTNAGNVQNKGFEILLNYQAKAGDFTYGITVNGTAYKNKVTSLGPGNRPIISGYGMGRTEVRSSIGRFYGYKTDGIFQTEQEVLDYKGPGGTALQPMAHAGDFRYKNTNNDEAIDDADKTWIGNPWPELTCGLNLNLAYKGIDLVVFFQGSYGNDIYEWGRWRGNNLMVNSYEYFYKNAWRGPGTSNSCPIMTTVDDNGSYTKTSDYYVEDGSYVRLKNVQLGYNLSKRLCEKIKITTGRIWLGGTDLLTFTRYQGNDPETGATANPTLDAGIDYGNFYPKPKEISLGITISL